MSFKLISDKITGNVLANSQALSKTTTTTLAQAGSSLSKIIKDTTAVTSSYLAKTSGQTGSGFYTPIFDMKDFAQKADPNNASTYNERAAAAITGMDANISNNLSGSNVSIFDIQKTTKESLAGGINSFGQDISKLNPGLGFDATSIGLGKLTETGRLIDSSVTGAMGAAKSSLDSTLSGINNSVMDKAIAEQKASKLADAANGVKELPGPAVPKASGTNPKASLVSAKGIDEGTPPTAMENSTDVLLQETTLFVEGVQIPFESISVGQSIGQLPNASFQVPPSSGLMDIIRGYQPKVHIFYKDSITGGDRLLFWGHVIACNYQMSQQQGYASISFECVHKNALLQQVTFEWSAGGAAHAINGSTLTDNNPDQATAQINNFNSEFSIARALQGINGMQTSADDLISPKNPKVSKADPTLLDKRFESIKDRMVGMPTSIMNLWNQIKLEVYSDEKLNIIFSKMFVPLIEDGIRFFDRLSGHVFLETQIQNSKVPYCNDKSRPELGKLESMLPPAFRVGVQSAVQSQLTVNSLKSSLGFSGELTNFYDLFSNFYYSIEYELLTLASPAEVPLNPTQFADPDTPSIWKDVDKTVVETVIKPQIPFYYAPICNVLLPNMFNELQVSQNEIDTPTRITAIGTAASQAADNPNLMGINYRAPQSVRESVALGRKSLTGASPDDNITLRDTTGSSFNIPGIYELGRGIRHKKIAMPNWLSHYAKDQDATRAANTDQEFPVKDSAEAKNLLNLHYAWIQKYGYKNVVDPESGELTSTRDTSRDSLDPYSNKSNIMAYERLLFASADYEYAKDVANSRNGHVQCIFNPYIVPGYPMDILDGSPNHPSFHAMCSSVTHSITSRSISTSVGFLAAFTYNELSNYYMQPVHPWLRTALSLVNVERGDVLTENGNTDADGETVADSNVKTDTKAKSLSSLGLTPDPTYDSNTGDIISIQQGIINNPRAKEAADNFYRSVLGVGAADPSLIYNFTAGRAAPLSRQDGNWSEGSGYADHSPANGGEGNPNLTGIGNLRLVARQIEGKKSIEAKFGLKFIDYNPQNYNPSSVVYESKTATDGNLIEPGASLFLNYGEISTLLDGVDMSNGTEESGT